MVGARRGDLRTLKRAVTRQGSVDAMLALLQRSVKLGHKRLALLRCLQAEQMGIQIRTAILAYCRAVAEQIPPADLERIAARVQRGGDL